jgi:6-phosphogluconolactonase (cycloisomerase 2 family)
MRRIALGVMAGACALSASFAVAATSAPAAFVYVTSNYSGANNRVVGYAATADGQLVQIAGSPWADNLVSLAVNGTYLFGSDNVAGDNGRNIYSYRIESNGVLQYIGATNIQKTATENECNGGGGLYLDHTGSYLYSFVVEVDCNSEAAFESFAVNKSTGLLNYLGDTSPNVFTLGPPLTVAADNKYAYAAGGNGSYSAISGFQIQSNGNLTDLASSGNYPFPSGQPSDAMGYIEEATADTTNHFAVNIFYVTDSGNSDKIATYAINTTTGNLTTSSTYSNMPTTEVGEATWQMMAPSGKLMAVAGPNGLQIFNFNPNGQATASTGLITRSPITMCYWDNNNHLYAISNADGTIEAFTVTPTGATEVAGSPWYLPHPVSMIVQPK